MKIKAEVEYLVAVEQVENVKARLEDAGGDPAAQTVVFDDAIVDNDDAMTVLAEADYGGHWGDDEPDAAVVDEALFVEAFAAIVAGDVATGRALLSRCCSEPFHRSLEAAIDAAAARAPAWSA